MVGWFRRLKPRVVITGGSGNIDLLAEQAAIALNIPVHVYEADWKRHGRSAGPIRNREMIDQLGDGDGVLAFWDGVSRGTWNTINLGNEKEGVSVWVRSLK